jgi:hypothetical protein
MGRRRELDEIDRYNAIHAHGRTRHSQRSLSSHARRQVSVYTRLERRKTRRSGTPSWSSLTGLGWLIIAGGIIGVLIVLALIVATR